MPQKPYANYSVEELALDDLFVRWIQHPDDEEVSAYWQMWLHNNPGRAETVDLARQLILTASQSTVTDLSLHESSTVWGRIRESLQGLEDIRPLQPDLRRFIGWWYFLRTVAATVGVVSLIGWAFWMQFGPDQSVRTVSTATGQTRNLRLPDNSQVTLYGNSSMRYARQWGDETPRAVWLEGTADFSVKHRNDTASARLFRVHTPDLTIEAVGTAFRVRQRPECTHVCLKSGQANLLLKQHKPIRLEPGDSVEVMAGLVQRFELPTASKRK
ncbi:FecR family protein [Spirosoma montaniterrae]|uniref:Iron dicitrate transport regulator FecR n=1 Tax=Spirosoma montaniterrae TaxID=1178516 RepID=A0A1P9WWF4_9BACT|nr:FecR family protein [Spirosoma montaniterrae]AQG79709.1 iron dicitrate transport regulator FecR [Spirosoma montaniterrae]